MFRRGLCNTLHAERRFCFRVGLSRNRLGARIERFAGEPER
jgi:hypothetical protein